LISRINGKFNNVLKQKDVGADDSVRPNLTKIGKIVNECWNEMDKIYKCIVLHDYIIMPNHIHGIIEIKGGQSCLPLKIFLKKVLKFHAAFHAFEVRQTESSATTFLQ